MQGIQQYQRAVTPTMTTNPPSSQARGKIVSYSTSRSQKSPAEVAGGRGQQLHGRPLRNPPRNIFGSSNLEVSGQAKPVAGVGRAGIMGARQEAYGVSQRYFESDVTKEHPRASTVLPRNDLEPFSEEIPSDGIIFARFRNKPESVVVFRIHDERARNPERLNLYRRQLEICPHLEMEQRLRLLNYQNNNIRTIQHLENLPNLIFLDLYNNKLTSLEGSISSVKGLRVLMVGKNRIQNISNLTQLRKLDVLDLHSNEISEITGLEVLTELRVLNLAGNRISLVHNLSTLTSLTELNLRRNNITQVQDLDRLPSLQRIFLSHNKIATQSSIQCLFSLRFLIELSLDNNPIAENDSTTYRYIIIGGIPSLKHLDLKRITDEERTNAVPYIPPPPEDKYFSPRQLIPRDPAAAITNSPIGSKPKNAKKAAEETPVSILAQHLTREGSVSPPMDSRSADDNASYASIDNGGDVAEVITSQRSTVGGPIQNLFEVEGIGNNEKSLLIVGDHWDWSHPKRSLSTVKEALLKRIRRDVIIGKFASNISWLPALKTLTLADNNITSLADVQEICAVFPGITSLSIIDNPVLDASPQLLRSFVIALLPNLENFNGKPISFVERSTAVEKYKAFLQPPKNSKTEQKPAARRAVPSQVAPNNVSEVANNLVRNVLKMRQMRCIFDEEIDNALRDVILETLQQLPEHSYL